MFSPGARQKMYLLLLVVALVAVFRMADLVERSTLPERQALEFSPPGGGYDRDQLLEIQPSRSHAPVIFTTNGAMPSATMGTRYERPLHLDSNSPGVTVVRAREYIDGDAGPVLSASFSVGVSHSLPILSVIADPADLWDPQSGILANPWQRGPAWEREVHVSFIETDGRVGFEIPAGLRIHLDDARFDGVSLTSQRSANSEFSKKQSFRLYFRLDHGAARLEYPLYPQHQQDVQSYKRLLLQAGDKSGRWTLLTDQLLSEIMAEINEPVARGRFVLLFLNGEPWGIYCLSALVTS